MLNALRLKLPTEVAEDNVRAFVRLHQLEIWLREMVYLELRAYYGDQWWSKAEAALKRCRSVGIPPDKSLKADRKHPHMSTPETDPLWFLSFESLLKVLFDPTLWRLFRPYLTTKRLLRAKFEEIQPVRNRIAHCRSLHTDDLPRLERVMGDLDDGFGKFWASYNSWCEFDGQLRKDKVFSYVSVDRGARLELDATYSLRALARNNKRSQLPSRGRLNRISFCVPLEARGPFDVSAVLYATTGLHRHVVYIILEDEHLLHLVLPAVLPFDVIAETIDGFFDACCEYRRGPMPVGTTLKDDLRNDRQEEERLRRLASKWPHYVIPPTSALASENRGYSGSFFGL